jgi:hypothetical protein
MDKLLNFFFSGLQKLEFGRCTLFPPGRAKDLSALRYIYIYILYILIHKNEQTRFLPVLKFHDDYYWGGESQKTHWLTGNC